MKQFLVPALLLALVGVSAAIAAGSCPATVAAPASEHCATGMSALVCPVSGGNAPASCPSMGSECHEAGAMACPTGEAKKDCGECDEPMEKDCGECDEPMQKDCVKKKMDCSKSPKPENVDR